MRSLRLASLGALLALGLMVSACAGTPPEGPPPGDEGSGELVFRIEQTGGMRPPGEALATVPELSLYRDGRLIRHALQAASGPSPALPALEELRVTRAGIERILALSEDAGVTDPLEDYGRPPVEDATTTVFVAVTGGERHVVAVYALGFAEADLTDRQAKARRALVALERRLTGDLGILGDELVDPSVPYEPERVALISRVGRKDPGVQVRPWPEGLPAPEAERSPTCHVVAHEEADRVLEAARDADRDTLWQAGDAVLVVRFRPLLSDEEDCADLEEGRP